MLNEISKIKGAKTINTKNQKFILGGMNCSRCYANNNGAYNINDPDCWGCGMPHEH